MDLNGLPADRRPGDGPRVVCLHAGVADRRSFAALGERLSRAGLDVVAPDRRGFGDAPPGEEGFTHLADLAGVLDALGREPVWLVGNSMGGALALDAALELPGRVAGLVLLAPAVGGAPEPSDDEVDAASLAIWERIEAAPDRGAAAALEVRLWLDGPLAPEGRVGGELRALALDMARRAPAEDEGGAGIDAWGRLGELRLPVTVAWGELDVPVVAAQAREVAARIPGARGVELPGVAHLPAFEDPEAVARLVLDAVGR